MSGTHEIIEINGELFGTGLLIPEVRPVTFAVYVDNGPMLTAEQCRQVVNDPKRKMGRKRFGEDWIRHQKSVGSCNGQAGAHSLERAKVLRGLKRVRLSGEGLYAMINGGRDQGSMLDDGMKWLTDHGCPEEQFVQTGKFYTSKTLPQQAKDSMAGHKALECYRCETEEEIVSGLAAGFVGVVAVHATNRWQQLDANGVASASDGPGNHAVLVDDVRWFSNAWQFDMANSWGLQFGERGRCWLTWQKHLRSTTKNHVFYLIRSSLDGGDRPPKPI